MSRSIVSTPPFDLPEDLSWRRVKVGVGVSGPYILAGPVIGLYTHHPGERTIPCLARLPHCTLPCPYCRFQLRYTSYTPVIDPSVRRQQNIVIQGGKRTYQSIVGGSAGQTWQVARGSGETDTPLFRPADPQLASWAAGKWHKGFPFDVSRYLLHLWQWRDLTEHMGHQFYPSLRTQELEQATQRLKDAIEGPDPHD